jgi:hypothetical protein
MPMSMTIYSTAKSLLTPLSTRPFVKGDQGLPAGAPATAGRSALMPSAIGAGGTTAGGTNGEYCDGRVGAGGNSTGQGTSGGGSGDQNTSKGTTAARGAGGGGGVPMSPEKAMMAAAPGTKGVLAAAALTSTAKGPEYGTFYTNGPPVSKDG